MSSFTDVVTMNQVAGNKAGDPIAGLDWGPVELYANLIEEELSEIRKAIEEKDYTKLKDGILDTLVVTYGCSFVAGLNADKGMKCIFESNMSKFCLTPEDAVDTQEWYNDEKGIDTRIVEVHAPDGNTYWVVKSSKEKVDVQGKKYPEGKFLKCVNTYREPDLDDEGLLLCNSSYDVQGC